MATHPIPDATVQERPLTREEGWAFFKSMRGIPKPTFDAQDGFVKFFREEREFWARTQSIGRQLAPGAPSIRCFIADGWVPRRAAEQEMQ